MLRHRRQRVAARNAAMVADYVDRHRSLRFLQERYHVSHETVRKVLLVSGVELRPRGGVASEDQALGMALRRVTAHALAVTDGATEGMVCLTFDMPDPERPVVTEGPTILSAVLAALPLLGASDDATPARRRRPRMTTRKLEP